MIPTNNDIWCIESGAFRQMAAIFEAWDGVVPEAREPAQPRRQKQVAILSLSGLLEPKTSLMGLLFGGTSTEAFGAAFDSVIRDERVGGVVIDVDSPGGTVFGTTELAAQIFEARGTKPIIAVANPVAASAALWIASAADRMIVTPSGQAGSVGVRADHLDFSKQMEADGVTATVITSKNAPFKAEAISSQPLSDAAKAEAQARIDAIESDFIADLSRNRGVSRDDVRANFGKGRMLSAKQAVASGMADRIGTLNQTVAQMAAGRIRLGARACDDNWNHSNLPSLKRRAALAGIDTTAASRQ